MTSRRKLDMPVKIRPLGYTMRWRQFIIDNELTYSELARVAGIEPYVMQLYLDMKRRPKDENYDKIEDAMKRILTAERIPHHPSYGYATPEQVQKLASLGLGPDRDALVKKIEQQNQDRGRVYK